MPRWLCLGGVVRKSCLIGLGGEWLEFRPDARSPGALPHHRRARRHLPNMHAVTTPAKSLAVEAVNATIFH